MKKLFIILLAVMLLPSVLRAGDAEKRFKTYSVLEKGEWTAGLSFLATSIGSDNSQFLLLVNGLDAQGKLVRVAPAFTYAYKDNASMGLRFSYGKADLSLDNVDLSLLSDDLAISLADMDASFSSWSVAAFHRNYIGLEKSGTVGLFCEFRLAYSGSRLGAGQSAIPLNQIKLCFAPGVVLYIFSFVSVEASVGIADFAYTSSKAVDTGSLSKVSGGVNFNILNCNFGINFHF